jgi:dipeptidyl aminopeptidase/acylaminoacyl peptidase
MPDSKAVLLQVYDRAQTPLYVQPLHGSPQRLALGPVIDASIQEQGSIARTGAIAFIGIERHRPGELYMLSPGSPAPRRLTSLNDGIAALQLGHCERIVWRGPGGMEEDGVLTYPPGFVPGRRYPLVLRIHGGPTESSTISFDQFWQLAAAHGYLVFAPNYRGSNDLGNAYEHAIFNDASIGPGEDIMAGIKAVQRLGIVDSSRIAVSGWSYGGLLTSWLEARYHIWRAAVAGAAVNDLVVDYAIADDIDADAISFAGGSPYKGNFLALWRKHSPITYFKDIKTPTLIFCNVFDVRVPIVESYEMYHALRDNGVPVKFYAYPTAGHLPRGPVRLADVYSKWLAWFDRYLH